MAETKLFPVTVVGSWTRPEWLVRALRSRQADEISAQEFNRIADDAVLSAINIRRTPASISLPTARCAATTFTPSWSRSSAACA